MAVLCDAATFKSYMNITSTDSSQDEFIDTILAWSDAQIVNICGQEIALTTRTLQFKGNGRMEYALPNHPVRSITSLASRSNSNTNVYDKVYTPFGATTGDYELVNNTIYFASGFSLSSGYSYQAVYQYGYQTIPYDVQSVALEMAAVAYRESSIKGKNDPRLGVSSVSTSPVGGVTTTKSFLDMMPTWDRSLSSYKYLGTF